MTSIVQLRSRSIMSLNERNTVSELVCHNLFQNEVVLGVGTRRYLYTLYFIEIVVALWEITANKIYNRISFEIHIGNVAQLKETLILNSFCRNLSHNATRISIKYKDVFIFYSNYCCIMG